MKARKKGRYVKGTKVREARNLLHSDLSGPPKERNFSYSIWSRIPNNK